MVSCERSSKCKSAAVEFIVIDRQLYCAQCNHHSCLAEILFDYCEDCNKMPSLPQGAFAAHKIRAQQNYQNDAVAKMQSAEKQPDSRFFPNKKLIDLSPLKYNSKLMNAIWGHYNRYSPHNIKSTDADASVGNVSAQQ